MSDGPYLLIALLRFERALRRGRALAPGPLAERLCLWALGVGRAGGRLSLSDERDVLQLA